MAKITVFSSTDILTKKFWKDGTKQVPFFSNGLFKVQEVNNPRDLADRIKDLSSKQALCYSIPPEFYQGTIVTQGNEVETTSTISRTKKYFDYPSAPGILLIDVDDGTGEGEVITKLSKLYPDFGKASYVYATSASNGINGKSGFHLYFFVEDISIVKQAMDNLFQRSFNADYGYCVVSKSGQLLLRTFFDNAVYDRARLDFISGPVCVDFEPPNRDIRVEKGEKVYLDLNPLLEAVDASEAIAKAKAAVSQKADIAIATEAKKRGISKEAYQALLQGDDLGPDVTLFAEDGTKLPVADILLTSMKAYIAEEELKPITIQHPIEHGLAEKTILYFNPETGVPNIHSFAHGGQTWKLKDDSTVISKLTGPDYLLERLKTGHGIPLSLPKTTLPLHQDTYAVLHLMLKTFIMEYGSDRLLIEQWRDMISLYLHMIDGHRGRYSIELPPSHGKTQVICHVILWLYQNKRIVPMSLSVFKINDIEKIQKWLLVRMEKEWSTWKAKDRRLISFQPENYLKVRHNKERTDFRDLEKTPVIIHTHHVVRRNDFREGFFTYKGARRNLFIFDEAMFRSLQASGKIEDCLDHLNYAITRGETGKVKGLPVKWLKAFKSKLQKASWRLQNVPTVKDVAIEMPGLSERFVNTGYYLEDERAQNFILPLLNIAASHSPEFRVSKEKGGHTLFSFKENDIIYLPSVINTDATRSVRKVHQYNSTCETYSIVPNDDSEPVTYWIAPFKKTGKQAIADYAELHEIIVNLWLEKIKPKKVLIISSKGMEFEIDHPDVQFIHWGQHKQTNDYQDYDAVIAMNYFRKPGYAYKHDIHAERACIGAIDSGSIREVEHGFIIDELIQGFGRGCMRKGMAQQCLMFSPHNVSESVALTEALEKAIRPNDVIELYEYDPVLSAVDEHYKTDQELRDRKPRSDRKYNSPKEKDWVKRFRAACRKQSIEIADELVEAYLQAKRADGKVTPVKWLKANITTDTIKNRQPKRR